MGPLNLVFPKVYFIILIKISILMGFTNALIFKTLRDVLNCDPGNADLLKESLDVRLNRHEH